MEYNLGSNRARDFKTRRARRRFEIGAPLLPELYNTRYSGPFSQMEAENSDTLELKTYTSSRKNILL